MRELIEQRIEQYVSNISAKTEISVEEARFLFDWLKYETSKNIPVCCTEEG